MDGEAPTLARASPAVRSRHLVAVLAALALTGFAIAVAVPVRAQALQGQGSCREGAPQGAWKLAAPNGTLRALGAFAHGKRTGSFIFWNAAGVRVAHLPYEDDAMNGTLALWYEKPVRGGEGQQRLEAVYAHGKLNGVKRNWHADGSLRGEYTYAGGALVDARAWDGRGNALSSDEAMAQANADFQADQAYYATLDRLVNRHRPCQESGDRGQGTVAPAYPVAAHSARLRHFSGPAKSDPGARRAAIGFAAASDPCQLTPVS